MTLIVLKLLLLLLSGFCLATLQTTPFFCLFLSSSFSLNNHHFLSLLLLNPPSFSLLSSAVCCCILFFHSNPNCLVRHKTHTITFFFWLFPMEPSENCSVKVALHIRPLIADERQQGCIECVSVTPGKPQVLSLFFLHFIFLLFSFLFLFPALCFFYYSNNY